MAVSTSVTNLANGVEKTVGSTSSLTVKPYLVFAIAPADGHAVPTLRVAAELINRGYEATFICGDHFEEMARRAGADFVDTSTTILPTKLEEYFAVPAGLARSLYFMRHITLRDAPRHWEVLKSQLERLRVEKPGREIVVLTDTWYIGAMPLMLGAALPKVFDARPKVINLHLMPYAGTSIDTAPFGATLPPDSTKSGRARNQVIAQLMAMGPFSEILAEEAKILKDLGCTKELPFGLPLDHWMLTYDKVLQLFPPSVEYPRSDMPPHVVFTGCPTPKPIAADYKYPQWWDDLTRGNRKVVVVTQGTVSVDYSDLLIPTITALGDRDDILVVAILGQRGASLPEEVAIPVNTRVVDYLPYDAVLPHTSAFVLNAGMGGFLHGITNGVPMVLAGESEDKGEVSMRGGWCGVGVNLQTGRPSPAALRASVDQVLADSRFKTRVEEVRRENEALKVFDAIEREILSVLDTEI